MTQHGDGQLPLGLEPERIGDIEAALAAAGHRWVIGVDEAGRGPLAGPVVVAAVAIPLPTPSWCVGLNDSKKLPAAARLFWRDELLARHVLSALVHVDAATVDRRNILQASLDGMRDAVRQLLAVSPELRSAPVLVDGNRPFGGLDVDERPIVRGDGRCFCIAAASVLAKVSRDLHMVALGEVYPAYGFERHFGYPTAAHLRALREHGPCPEHRRSYAPVAAAIRDLAVQPQRNNTSDDPTR